MILALLLFQSAALLFIFDTEIKRAGMEQYRPLLAAQIRQESAWNCEAKSRFAAGCAQFTPPTWEQYSLEVRPSCKDIPPTDPACSFRAQSLYMGRLLRSYRASATSRDRSAFALAAYNGGSGWIAREKRRCKQDPRCDPLRWWGHVADKCIRASWACKENREYPDRIFRFKPMFR